MTRERSLPFASLLFVLVVCVDYGHARDISGTISTTLTITEDSKLVGDVTCTVSGLPCIALAASGITLDLNGFAITGLGNAQTGCGGGPSTFAFVANAEHGILVNEQTGVTIRGPGLVQQFRGPGIFVLNSNSVTVTGVTASTNCLSGILFASGSNHRIEGNVAVRNGNGTFPCGGI